ncbi:MAG TPA: nitrous oxide reductase accessory protein NosL [Geobacteraceae bacterium]
MKKNMRNFLLIALITPSLMLALLSGTAALAADRVEPPKSCKQCGMDRVAFAHGRMLILYADGTSAATCSLNCAAVEMKANKGKRVKSLKVADYTTKKLVEAESAIWVMGGSKPGIMTEMPKWAFAKKNDAVKFIKEYGGRITDFNEALNLALRENEQ